MTTLRKPDGTESAKILDKIKAMMNHLIPDDIEESHYHKQLRKTAKEPIDTRGDRAHPKGN
jgi:hypothetical protein